MSTNINQIKFLNEIDSLQLNVKKALTSTKQEDITKAWRDAAINAANLITAGAEEAKKNPGGWGVFTGLLPAGAALQDIAEQIGEGGTGNIKISTTISLIGSVIDTSAGFVAKRGMLPLAGGLKLVGLAAGLSTNAMERLGLGEKTFADLDKAIDGTGQRLSDFFHGRSDVQQPIMVWGQNRDGRTFAPDGVTPLGEQQTTQAGPTERIRTFWQKDNNGNYQKVETLETLQTNGAWKTTVQSVYQYNSDGAPVKATQYNFDSNGNTTSTKALVPTAGGSWVDAPAGTPTSPIEKIAGETFTYQTTTLAGTANAGMYTATEVTNTKTGEVDYVIRHNGTGETVASGSSYVVNANDTVTTTSGGTKFTHGLTDGRMRVMQSANGSGFVVGQSGNDFYFDAGSTVRLNANGSVTVDSPVVNGAHTQSTYAGNQLVSAERITNAVGGNLVDGFKAISTSSNGSNWSAPTYTFTNANAAAEADNAVWAGLANGTVSRADFENIANASADFLVNPTHTFTAPAPDPFDFWFDPTPIGAFYDSQSAAFDNAASIANKTTRAMNASGQALSAQQMAALDANNDGQISTVEAAGMRLWADLNENGALDTNELQSVGSAIQSADYGFYTQGNGLAAASGASGTAAPGVISVSAAGNRPAPALRAASSFTAAGLPNAPTYGGVPASNYRSLRDTDNIYYPPGGGFIVFTASMVKINNGNRSYMVGTDGADSFDSGTYAQTGYFNNNLLTNFLAGGGNDEMGGSVRNDNLWGGTGNDSVYGYAGDDKVYGEEGDDQLLGQDGNDSLDGGVGNDALVGGNGNDTAWGGDGADELQGQDGADQLMGQAGNDVLFGQVGNDSLWGSEGDDLLMGFTANNEAQQSLYAGQTDNDVLMGEGGNDTLLGGVGQDLLDGGVGNDALDGGAGDDTMQGQAGADELYGGEGADRLDGGTDNDALQGQAGDDSLWGGDGADELQGGDGADQLMGQSGNDKLFGQVGNDSLWGGEGDDTLLGFTANNEAQQSLYAGQTDNDVLMGEGGKDEIFAGVGDDLADGGTGDDLVDGGEGNDTLLGGAGNDQLQGQAGQDVIDAGDGNDVVLAGLGNDTAWGGTGADELQGNEGNDHLMGEADNDRLFGQVGNDTLQGGDGDDILVGFTASNEAKQSLSAGETDDDVLQGGAGHDNLYGGTGQDALDGGTGNDIMLGEGGNDSLWGGDGQDEMQGNAGHDQLDGGAGDDKLFGQAGNDTMWGGDGNDLLMGFTASNEDQQSLYAGETDDDLIWAGAGSDVVIAGVGQDTVYGGTGRDELQGGAGHDMLYGEDGSDNLFGQVGNDTVYGGEGDDYIQGFTASNETQQSLNAGETDDDKLYGGAGQDTLSGGVGNDYLDGGAGADDMIGGQGNDVYIVNTVNDTIYEKANEGYDTVITNSNYLLNTNIEELRLLEGFNIHGTGNALNNKIIGNSADNILDGITGADTMLGGAGNDTYYVDNAGDVVTELAGEGSDVVQTSISLTLGAHVENLVLLDFSKPEKGLVDGANVLVYGYPKRNELDYMQGDAVDNFAGTCALTSIANLLTQTGKPTTESQVVNLAIDNNWAVTNPDLPSYQLGGSNVNDQRNILNSYNIRNDVIAGYNENGLANLLRSGRGVILAVNAGALWGDSAYTGTGAVNHAVTLTGAVYNEADGSLMGFYLADSGRGKVSDMTRFVDIAPFRQAANVTSAYAIYTIEPVKYWQEDINGTGNDLANSIAGNRGDNVLSGLAGADVIAAEAGHDTLIGGAGNDTLDGGSGDDVYQFALGDGADTIADSQGVDKLIFGAGIAAANVQLTLANGRLTLAAGTDSVSMQAGAGKLLEQVQFANGTVWHARADGTGYNATMSGQLSITGTAQQGQTLSLSNTLTDPDGLGAFTYQWERSSNGVDWTVLSDATAATLVLGQDLVGQRLRAKTAFTDGRGNAEAVISYTTAVVANVNDAPTGGVSLSGTAQQGKTLTASHTLADADGLGTVSYQWLADGQAIAGATGSTLQLVQAQVGQAISVSASYTDGFGAQEAVSSTASAVVANVNDAPTGSVSISGTAQQGQTLTASNTLADADGLGTVSYQWLADGQAIAGATGSTLVLGQAQLGQAISVRASYTDGQGTSERVQSNSTGQVTAPWIRGTNAAEVLFGQNFAEILSGEGGNDTLVGGLGRDTLAGGEGSDTADYSSTVRAAGQTQGVLVNLQTGQQVDLVQRNSFANGTASMLAQGVKLADLDVENLSFVMQGSWINLNKPVNGQAILVNRSTPGQVTMWAATVDGSMTKAVQLKLVETEQGVTVQTLQAKYTSGNFLNGSFNFNTSGAVAPVATAAGTGGYGVAVIHGRAFGDTLSGVESLMGSVFNDQLIGDAAANNLNGGSGNDTLSGGGGRDTLVGGTGADTADYSSTVRAAGQTQGVLVNLQTGQQVDLVQRNSFANGTASMLAQGVKLADLDVENLSFVMQGSWINLNKPVNGQAILVNRSTPGQVTMWAATVDGSMTKAVQLKLVETEQGVTVQTLQAKYTSGNFLNGSFNFNNSGNAAPVALQSGSGGYGVAAISGRVLGDSLIGVENLVGSAFNDQLTGDAAANSLNGGAGNDTLTGAAGNDTLSGGAGGDTYLLGRGSGQDLVVESDATAGAWDVAQWDGAVSSSQLWFTRAGTDLQVSVIGTSDRLTVQNWYVGAANQIEQFKAGDGKSLLNTQVNALVNAMAQFAPPAAGQTTLSASQQTALSPTLAANWK